MWRRRCTAREGACGGGASSWRWRAARRPIYRPSEAGGGERWPAAGSSTQPLMAWGGFGIAERRGRDGEATVRRWGVQGRTASGEGAAQVEVRRPTARRRAAACCTRAQLRASSAATAWVRTHVEAGKGAWLCRDGRQRGPLVGATAGAELLIHFWIHVLSSFLQRCLNF